MTSWAVCSSVVHMLRRCLDFRAPGAMPVSLTLFKTMIERQIRKQNGLLKRWMVKNSSRTIVTSDRKMDLMCSILPVLRRKQMSLK